MWILFSTPASPRMRRASARVPTRHAKWMCHTPPIAAFSSPSSTPPASIPCASGHPDSPIRNNALPAGNRFQNLCTEERKLLDALPIARHGGIVVPGHELAWVLQRFDESCAPELLLDRRRHQIPDRVPRPPVSEKR